MIDDTVADQSQRASKPTDAIKFSHVSYGLSGGAGIIEDLSFDVAAGETIVLLGRSGSGKTTTLKLINRLLEATAGEIAVQGRPVCSWDVIQLRRSIGFAIQEGALFPHYSVERNIGLIPEIEGWNRERIQTRVTELLHLVGLDEKFGSRYPRELSGGQRQRVGVARALAADPPILLMDEPFGALDAITRAELQREFRQLQQTLKKTVVFVTHDLHEAMVLADRIALIEEGKLVAMRTPSQFLHSTDPRLTTYLNAFRIDEESVAHRDNAAKRVQGKPR